MTQLDLYLAKTIGMTMLMAILGLVGMLTLFTFLEQIEDVNQGYTMGRVAEFVIFSMPRMFYETIPYSALIGCLAGLGVLANNSELLVMRAAGISTWRIASGVMVPALILVMIGLAVGEWILPDFERKARLGREQALSTSGNITPLFGFWYREGDIYMHFDQVDQSGVVEGLTHFHFENERELTKSVFAKRAVYHDVGQLDGNYWLMENLTVTEYDASGSSTYARSSEEWYTRLTPQLLSTEILVQPDKMSIGELLAKIDYLKAQGLNTGKFELGFWGKALQPLATVALVFVAISFIFGPLREATMGMRVVTGLIIGIVFKFVQDLLSPASLVFGFEPILAVLIPILLCFLFGYFLLRRAG